ncbi:exosome 3'-_5 exonuclease subunit ski4 (Csl4) [Apiotrichum porosum]|uniref:Exosome 3'->5 exonuclease subunit ski4 (Csl4) n=1 Tax=Apiotrichum porosum TaxID=105984 RepID=A0A427Y0B0_9TREE|nr:exosome 3'->5 exonuclease subunit ski4 (Csl4) [Apiotrichum porosum]RSH84566.1 exosome 3'->5 exonuclease subunit ski4 (Csl4) [Apiotrichum porosum]
MASQAPLLVPGQPLPASFIAPPLPQAGPGCYEYQGKILASVVGRPHRDGAVVSVIGKAEAGAVPDIGAVVIGQQAHIVIQIVNNRPVAESSEELTGVVRVADIRLTERDKVKIGECFRLGDIVKAKVLSLGDARSYYLSTAANELGVVYATSEDGHPLLPVSYQEMEDPQTGKTEKRKVAKPEGV